MSKPSVSVLMNCYNGGGFIADSIRSVLDQSYRDFELFIWDNRSTDNSANIVSTFGDERIRYVLSDRHTTLAEARKLALPFLRGQWVGILDVDDLWQPDKLEKQVDAIGQKPEAAFVYCGTTVLYENRNESANHVLDRDSDSLPEGDIYPELLRGNFIAIASLLFDREKLVEIGGFSGRYPIMEDYFVTLNLARKFPVVVVREALCSYRVHGSNASLRDSTDHFEDLDIVRDLFPDPRAMLSALRIVARHFKKCLVNRQQPQLRTLGRVLAFGFPKTT